MNDTATSTVIEEDVDALCSEIAATANKVGIRLRFIGPAGPEFRMPHAPGDLSRVIEFLDPGDVGLMDLQQVCELGPYEFSCDWDWTGQGNGIYRRAVPIRDLALLLVCLRWHRIMLDGTLPHAYQILTRRRFGITSATATVNTIVFAETHAVWPSTARRRLTRQIWLHHAATTYGYPYDGSIASSFLTRVIVLGVGGMAAVSTPIPLLVDSPGEHGGLAVACLTLFCVCAFLAGWAACFYAGRPAILSIQAMVEKSLDDARITNEQAADLHMNIVEARRVVTGVIAEARDGGDIDQLLVALENVAHLGALSEQAVTFIREKDRYDDESDEDDG